jgi:acetyl/propionyl-CoA carboxylase alpha subunit
MVTGIDLVKEQILIAAGNELSIKQDDLKQNGHAIECRIYAEDPANNFLPSPGKMTLFKRPEGENIRIDSAIDGPATIHSFYDPMISKLIVWSQDRETAIEKSIQALKNFHIHGIKTNINYLIELLNHKAFRENKISTKFCDEHTGEIIERIHEKKRQIGPHLPVFAFMLHNLNNRQEKNNSVWHHIGYWRNLMKIPFEIEGEQKEVFIDKIKWNQYFARLDEKDYRLCLKEVSHDSVRFELNNRFYKAFVSTDEKGQSYVSLNGFIFEIKRLDILNESEDYSSSAGDAGDSNLFAPMPGKVIKVNVKPGDQVKRGSILVVVEAMKMENNIIAVHDAVVEKVAVKEGDMVDSNVQLVYLKEEE